MPRKPKALPPTLLEPTTPETDLRNAEEAIAYYETTIREHLTYLTTVLRRLADNVDAEVAKAGQTSEAPLRDYRTLEEIVQRVTNEFMWMIPNANVHLLQSRAKDLAAERMRLRMLHTRRVADA